MKCTRKKPCGECPFRVKAMQGWLGTWEPQQIADQAHSEAGLPCHLSVTAVQKRDPGISDEDIFKTAHVCVGSLQSASVSHKSYREPRLRAMQDKVGASDAVMDRWRFLDYHSYGKIPDFRKAKK